MAETVRYVAVSMTGFAVEWGWAVGESIMIPHLLARPLRLSPAVAGLIYCVNPVFSFLIAPVVGRRADAPRALAPVPGRREDAEHQLLQRGALHLAAAAGRGRGFYTHMA